MTNVYPKNNLPASSQQWGRVVQNKIDGIEKELSIQKINSNSADSQLQSSYRRLDDTVKSIINLSSEDSPYTINASNISGGTFTSNTTQKQRVEVVPTKINFYGEDLNGLPPEDVNQIAGSIAGANSYGFGIPFIIKRNLVISSNDDIELTTPDNVVITKFLGGATTGASISGDGSIIRTTSSERYKQDIEPLEVNYEDLLSLEPKRFRLKNEAAADENARYYAGFIAEEIAETSLTDFVAYKTNEDGSKEPDGVYYAELSAALLSALKQQDTLIKSLTARVETLENKDRV